MPLIQHYEVEVEVIVRVRNTSNDTTIVQYSTMSHRDANSYDTAKSIPAAATKCIDDLHKKVGAIARLTRDQEKERLAR